MSRIHLPSEVLDRLRKRRRAGESLPALAAEIGLTWQKLDKALRHGRKANLIGESMYQIKTTRGYLLSEVASALQKAIRRADARLAGYWAIEMFESGYQAYLWRRLLTISAEDCFGVITHEVEALYRSWDLIDKSKKGGGRIFASKAVILLSLAAKSRDADHLTNLVYDPKRVDEGALERDLTEARKSMEPIPDYALDCHTAKGKKAGKTKKDFFRDEHEALKPRAAGLFDREISN